MNDPAREQFRLTNEISPIILTNGVATDLGGKMPIISITQGLTFPGGVLSLQSLSGETDLDDFFAHFAPVPGATLINNQIGRYPFANQQIAANAIISQPLQVSLMMICPARGDGAYPSKLATFQAVQAMLYRHSLLGGTYTVVTPAWVYYDCILIGLRDVSSGEGKQVQTMWQWDFEQPLITQAQAQEAQSALTQRITNQSHIASDPPKTSGLATAVGFPGSSITPSLIPASSNLGGALVGQFGKTFLSGGPAAITRLGGVDIASLAGPAGSAALESFLASGSTSRAAQTAMRVAGVNVVGVVTKLAGQAVQGAQAAVLAASGGSAVPAAERALHLSMGTLGAANGALGAVTDAASRTAVGFLVQSSQKAVAAATAALAEAVG